MEIFVKILSFILIMFSFVHCSRHKTYDERNIERDAILNRYIAEDRPQRQNTAPPYAPELNTDNNIIQSPSIYDGTRFINKSPNNYNNIYSAFLLNDNYIIIDDYEYGSLKIYLDGNISPIGWSDNGRFAFAQFSSYGRDDYNPYSRIIIFNIITDEIEDVVDNLNYFEQGAWLDEITFDEFWIKYNKEIYAILKKNEINPFSDLILWNIETLKERHDLEIVIEDGLPKYIGEIGSGPQSARQSKNIVIKNSDDQTKIIAEVGGLWFGARGDEMDMGDFSILDFIGYYEFPYGDRIVFYFYDRVFSGFFKTWAGSERLAGCHLTSGYK
jgi:hypothetical protein